MKKIYLSLLATVFATSFSYAQTNTFPSSGNTGIGTTSPRVTIEVASAIATPTALSSNTTAGNFMLSDGGNVGSVFGVTNPSPGVYTSYWQSRNNNGANNLAYPLSLNPLGGNVGIGTTSPAQKLDVNGVARIDNPSNNTQYLQLYTNNAIANFDGNSNSNVYNGVQHIFQEGGSEKMRIDVNGNFGINTTNPGALLESHLTSGGVNALRLNSNFSGGNAIDLNPDIPGVNNGGFSIGQSGTTRFVISPSGNVGIGTTIPDEKLSVLGNIRANEVKVDLSVPGPDYVFNADYKLTGLSELKVYVDKNHHLPEIPSAEQMAKDGLSLGAMNTRLLKKVEELTLYLIEKDQQVNSLQNELTQLRQSQQKEIDELKKQVSAITIPKP